MSTEDDFPKIQLKLILDDFPSILIITFYIFFQIQILMKLIRLVIFF